MARQLTRRDALLLALCSASVSRACAAPAGARPGAVPQALRRGFNLPDQAPLRAQHQAKQETLRALRQMGMTHVRLPVAAEYVLSHFSGPATVDAATGDLDRALDRLLKLGYCVSVDMHPGSDFGDLQRRDPAVAHKALLEGWLALATRLSRWPHDRVFAELLNEPATTDDIWRPFVESLAQAVRAVLPDNWLIVGAAPFQRMEALANWRPLPDRNIVYACHFYDPLMFTHQGAAWEQGSPWARAAGVPFPSAANDPRLLGLAESYERAGDAPAGRELRQMAQQAWGRREIEAQFAKLARWSSEHAAPIVVNEFGVLKWKAKRADRLAWIAAVRAAAEDNNFGWAHWDYATSFGLLDDAGAIDAGLVRALLPG